MALEVVIYDSGDIFRRLRLDARLNVSVGKFISYDLINCFFFVLQLFSHAETRLTSAQS